MPMFKAVVPKELLFNPRRLARAVENALNGAAAGAKADFASTVATWKDKPSFTVSRPDAATRVVSTADLTYTGVDYGTKAHTIRPKNGKRLFFKAGFRPKTRAGYIGSNAGSAGSGLIVAKVVRHPGTKARGLSKAIAAKWQKELPVIMQRAIDSEVQ